MGGLNLDPAVLHAPGLLAGAPLPAPPGPECQEGNTVTHTGGDTPGRLARRSRASGARKKGQATPALPPLRICRFGQKDVNLLENASTCVVLLDR